MRTNRLLFAFITLMSLGTGTSNAVTSIALEGSHDTGLLRTITESVQTYLRQNPNRSLVHATHLAINEVVSTNRWSKNTLDATLDFFFRENATALRGSANATFEDFRNLTRTLRKKGLAKHLNKIKEGRGTFKAQKSFETARVYYQMSQEVSGKVKSGSEAFLNALADVSEEYLGTSDRPKNGLARDIAAEAFRKLLTRVSASSRDLDLKSLKQLEFVVQTTDAYEEFHNVIFANRDKPWRDQLMRISLMDPKPDFRSHWKAIQLVYGEDEAPAALIRLVGNEVDRPQGGEVVARNIDLLADGLLPRDGKDYSLVKKAVVDQKQRIDRQLYQKVMDKIEFNRTATKENLPRAIAQSLEQLLSKGLKKEFRRSQEVYRATLSEVIFDLSTDLRKASDATFDDFRELRRALAKLRSSIAYDEIRQGIGEFKSRTQAEAVRTYYRYAREFSTLKQAGQTPDNALEVIEAKHFKKTTGFRPPVEEHHRVAFRELSSRVDPTPERTPNAEGSGRPRQAGLSKRQCLSGKIARVLDRLKKD